MKRDDHERSTENETESQFRMSDELIALLRHRVATGFYEQPHVIDAVARAMVRGGW